MPADPSIYGNVQTPQINIPNPLDMAQKSMQLSQLGMQQIQMARQMRMQSDVQDAYLHNTDQTTGQLDQAGVVSQLSKTNPMAAQQVSGQFASQNKAQAEAKAAQLDAQQKTLSLTGPAFDYMAKMPEDQRAAAYPSVVAQLKDQGVDTSRMDHPYDPGLFNQYLGAWRNGKQSLENQIAQTTIGDAGIKRQGEQFGSRSPNATLSDQYDKQAAPLKQSATYMNQMIENHKNPTPQGDASMILNAYKVLSPNAPDVNSLKELSESQSAPDAFKNYAAKYLAGGIDKATRDNLLRDSIDKFQANHDTLEGIQQKTQARQQFQGVNDPTMTYEPGMEKTYKSAMDYQKKIGPYVPPAERGGFMGGVSALASKILGVGGSQSATASDSIKMMSPGGKIKMVPASMKGEAIAAGGKVVK